MKITTLINLLLLITCLPAHAGKIYRFIDDNGVSTLSKSLPPYVAQKGYDILDDQSLRLIERVYTRDELIQIQEKQAIEDQIKAQVEQRKQDEQQRRLDQRIHDKNLLARYPTLEVFTKSRDDDLNYRQGQINDVNEQLKKNKQRLIDLQVKAAELELAGDVLSTSLTKRLNNLHIEIDNNKAFISRAYEEKRLINQQYNIDFERLNYLFSPPEN